METLGFLLGRSLNQFGLVATVGPVGSETEGSRLGLGRLLGRVRDVLLARLALLLLGRRIVLLLVLRRRRREGRLQLRLRLRRRLLLRVPDVVLVRRWRRGERVMALR